MTHERLHIPNAVLAKLSDLSHDSGVTLFVTLLAGFKVLLSLRNARNDICVATAMSNRVQPGTQNVIGPFANTAIIRARIDADLSFYEVLDRVREAVLGAYANQELPFDILADRLADESGLDRGGHSRGAGRGEDEHHRQRTPKSEGERQYADPGFSARSG